MTCTTPSDEGARITDKLLSKGWDRVLVAEGLVIAIQPGIYWACDTGSGYTKGRTLIVPLRENLTVGRYDAEVRHFVKGKIQS